MAEFMTVADKIFEKLMNDLQNIAKSFIVYFKNQNDKKINDPILNWIEYVIRLIPPKEREVHFSKGFWNRAPQKVWPLIHHLADKFEYGQDVNPYLSTTVQNALQGKRTDMLWTDWEIHHFHLSDEFFDATYFAKRSDYTLFAIVGDYFACFLDVRPHPKGDGYADPELYKYICESWPELVDDLKDITPDKEWTKEEIYQFRKRGLNVCYSYNGQAMAIGGLTSPSGKSMRSIILHDKISFELKALSKRLAEYAVNEFVNFSENDFSLNIDQSGVWLYCSQNEENVIMDEQSYPTINCIFNQKWLVEKAIAERCRGNI